jgi:hypothetical protein
MAFLDPMSIVDSQNAPQQNPLQGAMNAGSSIDKLTKKWALSSMPVKSSRHDLPDEDRPRPRPDRRQSRGPVLTDRAVNTNEVVTSQIDNILLPFAGAFTGTPADGLKETVLMHSSPQSQLVEKFMAEFGSQNITKDFQPSGKEYAWPFD